MSQQDTSAAKLFITETGLLPPSMRLRQSAARLWSNAMFLWMIALLVYAVGIGHAIKKLFRPDDPLGDFFTFRNAAIALSRGRDLYAGSSNEYVYPPLIAFLYQPLARLSLHAAGTVTLIINALLSFATLWLVGAEMSGRLLNQNNRVVIARIGVVAAWLTFDKIRAEFNMWETNALLLFMITAALALADRRPSIAGAALGFAFNIKYLPLTLLAYLILRHRWRMAGGFVASGLVFALVPAIAMGWSGNLRALAEAYGGLAGLFKIPVEHAAHLFPMTDSRTISAASGIARMTGWPDRYALAMAAALGLVFVSFAALDAERHKLAPRHRLARSEQDDHGARAMFGVEWVAVMMLTLVFSPFTNAAHLYLLLLANAAGAALLFSPRHRSSRLPLIISMGVMFFGVTLPPGGEPFREAEDFTKWIGLPAWCVLVNCGTLLWTGLRIFCPEPATASRPVAVAAAPPAAKVAA